MAEYECREKFGIQVLITPCAWVIITLVGFEIDNPVLLAMGTCLCKSNKILPEFLYPHYKEINL